MADQDSVVSSSPQPPRRRSRLLWILLLAIAVGGAVWIARARRTSPQQGSGANPNAGPAAGGGPAGQTGRSSAKGGRGGPSAVPVAAAKSYRGDIPVYQQGLGSVSAFYTVTVRSRVDGQLMNVAVHEGDYVQKGQLLAQIDPRPFQVQLEQAQGQMVRDEALLQNARLDLTRYQTLIQQEAIPQQQLDTQKSTVAQYEGTVKQDQATINNAELQLTYARVTAPISGRIGLRQVDPGNIVHASDTTGMLVITQLQPIAVLFTIPEDNLPPVLKKLRAGAKLPVDAYNRDMSTKLDSGTLQTVDNTIDQQTGTSKLKAVFNNRAGLLFPNQFVNVRLLVDTQRAQVIIPAVALQRGQQGTFVYVVKANNTVEARNIQTGVTVGDVVSVRSGLQPGEMVVTDGTDKLQPGSQVRVREPSAVPGGRQHGGATGPASSPGGGPPS